MPATFDVSIGTDDGDVDVEGITGATEIQTGDGDVRVADVCGPGVVDLLGESISVGPEFGLESRLARRAIRARVNGGGPVLYAHTGDRQIVLRRR